MVKRYLPAQLFPVALALVLTAVLLVTAASCTMATPAADRISVVVTILPQAEFVESVGGEKVDITVMVPAGADPHTYEPTPSQITALSRAKMYAKVGSGIEFELAWLDKLIAVNQDMLVVDCAQGVELHQMAGRDDGPHGATDPHIWMSPLNAQIMVRNICAGLIQIDPDNQAYYRKNCNAYLHKLTQLDQDIRAGLSRVTNRTFMVYHPAFSYFARDYGLTMLTIAAEGKEPTPAGLVRLTQQAKEHKIRVIFASPQFNPESARVIADAINARVVFINPLARDYIANLRLFLAELIPALE